MTLDDLFKIIITATIGTLSYFFKGRLRQLQIVEAIAYDALDRAKHLETVIEYHEKQINESSQTHKELREVLHSLDKTCVKLTETMQRIKKDRKK
ncbi:hypothetical protein [Leptospira kirschneri]|uniref:hypothetical protein n=1 Tax=Leptospira kirschneri TaxID=29507 RepID=UPI00046C57D4|nr:hypothetical protein [Leptospira kirschneri]